MTDELVQSAEGLSRCFWCMATPTYQHYHDTEWGVPEGNDQALFEKLCLESFQAGLSWSTILYRRDAFRAAFAGFDWQLMTAMGPADVDALLQNAGIIRHRGKIEAVIHNARCMPTLIAEEGSLARFIWSFEPAASTRPESVTLAYMRANTTTPESIALARELKRRGWKFLGPTTAYALMQAMGLVNDHFPGCHRHAEIEALRNNWPRPR